MKKTIFTFSSCAMLFLAMSSCSGSSESKDLETEIEMPQTETEEPVADENDFSSITTAEDAMDEYKSLLEEYADKVKNGEVDGVEELKAKLDELKSYAEGAFGSDELKALADLTKITAQLEAGKSVDLNKAFSAYEKSLDMLKDMPMDDETKDALKQSQDAMNKLKGLGGL